MERFLYRLSQSAHNRCFTLKGALLLWAMQGPDIRPTRDIDMLGQTSNNPKRPDIAEAHLTPLHQRVPWPFRHRACRQCPRRAPLFSC
nr:nucleotidyl transferase AbiEii/AbiGii toxin family protein [Halomonas sp. HL-48]